MFDEQGHPALKIEPAYNSYPIAQQHNLLNEINTIASYLRETPPPPPTLPANVNQRVERSEETVTNTWEGEDASDMMPGVNGPYIITPKYRKFKIILTVYDSRIGVLYLLNTGNPSLAQSARVMNSLIPSQYRVATTYAHRLFVCEYNNKVFSVQACEPDAPVFTGCTTTAAWVKAVKHYCPNRKNFRLSGPLFFGIALQPVQELCKGLRYIQRRTTPRTYTSSRKKLKNAEEAEENLVPLDEVVHDVEGEYSDGPMGMDFSASQVMLMPPTSAMLLTAPPSDNTAIAPIYLMAPPQVETMGELTMETMGALTSLSSLSGLTQTELPVDAQNTPLLSTEMPPLMDPPTLHTDTHYAAPYADTHATHTLQDSPD